jgi:hypothetical protein
MNLNSLWDTMKGASMALVVCKILHPKHPKYSMWQQIKCSSCCSAAARDHDSEYLDGISSNRFETRERDKRSNPACHIAALWELKFPRRYQDSWRNYPLSEYRIHITGILNLPSIASFIYFINLTCSGKQKYLTKLVGSSTLLLGCDHNQHLILWKWKRRYKYRITNICNKDSYNSFSKIQV